MRGWKWAVRDGRWDVFVWKKDEVVEEARARWGGSDAEARVWRRGRTPGRGWLVVKGEWWVPTWDWNSETVRGRCVLVIRRSWPWGGG